MLSNRPHLSGSLLVLGLLSCVFLGCSTTSEGNAGSGGKPGSGGTSASGGSGSGGTVSTGGINGTGGTVGSGGTMGTGGKGSGGEQGTGGKVGTGGSGSGGTNATGGSAPGGAAAGNSGKGGSAPGGAVAGSSGKGGAAGSPIGGSGTGGSNTGGAAGGSGKGSPGCGSASPLKTSTSLTETIGGKSRKWMLDVPTSYDTNKMYKLIFVWHPLGGSGSQIVSGGYNGLKSLSNGSTVFATADGLNGSNSEASGTGWWNADGGDMKLFQAMLDKINAGLCIDQDRIFTTGFSFGGMMSYTLPFEFDVFRATAPCSGKTGVIPYNDKFSGPVAIMAFHGDSDTFVATNLGKAFFDKFATRNKCGTGTTAVSPTGCNEYKDCVVPSTWCLFHGQHETWSEEPGAIWKFFSSF